MSDDVVEYELEDWSLEELHKELGLLTNEYHQGILNNLIYNKCFDSICDEIAKRQNDPQAAYERAMSIL